MCLTPRQYNTTERLNHTVWKTKIIQKQMTEIMEDLDECVSNGKYTDGEYLALSKEIQSGYEQHGKLEKIFTEIKGKIEEARIFMLERFDGNIDEALGFLSGMSVTCRTSAAALSEEEVFTEAITTFHGDYVVEHAMNALGAERWGEKKCDWEWTHVVGIQLDGLLRNTDLYAQAREEGHYEVKELFGL